jgi:hypothetical protein
MFRRATLFALASLVLSLGVAASASADSNRGGAVGDPSAAAAQVAPPPATDPVVLPSRVAAAIRRTETAQARSNATLAKINSAYGGGE